MATINGLSQNRLLRTAIKDITTELGRVQQQVATGLKGETFADYGAATSRRLISLRNETFRIDSYNRTIQQLDLRAGRADLALEQINSKMDVVNEASLKATNRLSTSDELVGTARGALSEMYSNLTAEVAGHFIFSGTAADQSPLAPLADIEAGVQAAIAAAVPANDPAAVVAAVSDFFADETNWYRGGNPPAGVEVAPNQSVGLRVLANDRGIRDALTAVSTMAFASPAALGQDGYLQAVDGARTTLASGSDATGRAVARNGLLRSELDVVRTSHAQHKTYIDTQLGDLESVDPYEAVTRLQALETQLQATFQITARLKDLSLTNYLR